MSLHDGPFRTDVYLRLLALADGARGVRTLNLDSACVWSVERLGALLVHVGDNLRHLRLDVSKQTEPAGTSSLLQHIVVKAVNPDRNLHFISIY